MCVALLWPGPKRKGTKPQDSQVKSKESRQNTRPHARTDWEMERERERERNPQPGHGGKGRPFVFVVNVVCGLPLLLSPCGVDQAGCGGTWHSSILWTFAGPSIQSFVFCHINNSLLLFAPLPVPVCPGTARVCVAVRIYIYIYIYIDMYTYLSVHSPHYSTFIILQLVKVPAYAHLFYFGARSLIIISSSRGKLQPSTRDPRPRDPRTLSVHCAAWLALCPARFKVNHAADH